jgi:hypothetical protein
MNRNFTLAFLLLSIIVFGQAPQLIPYQAIARDAAEQPLSNATINARFTIHDGAATGASVWQEIQTVSTSPQGLFTVQLGSNISLSAVNWAGGSKYMQVEVDLGGGFVDMGTQQMLSVPYAMYALNSGSSTPGPQGPTGLAGPQGEPGVNGANGLSAYQIWLSQGNEGTIEDYLQSLQANVLQSGQLGDMLYWNGIEWSPLVAGQDGSLLTLCNGIPHWGPCPVVPPTISTKSITSVNPTSFTTGMIILDDGGDSILAAGICYSTVPNPTILDQVFANSDLSTDFDCTISGLLPSTTYYVRAFASNSSGTSYGQQVEVITTNYQVGTVGPGGGIIFYDKGVYSAGLYSPEWRYMEILPFDIANSQWGCTGVSIGGYGTYSIVGAAFINTTSIFNYCTSNPAARICYYYTYNGFSDWLMPSSDELVLAYNVLNPLGLGNLTGTYWSSTQASGANAYYMTSGGLGITGKSVIYPIRAVRIF